MKVFSGKHDNLFVKRLLQGCLTVVLNFSSIFYSSVSLLGINETVDCTITANDEDLLYVMTGKVKPRAVRVDVFLFRNTEMEKTEKCSWIPVIEKKNTPPAGHYSSITGQTCDDSTTRVMSVLISL